MKKVLGAVLFMSVLSAYAQPLLWIDPKVSKNVTPFSAKDLRPEVIQAMCGSALLRDESNGGHLEIKKVTVGAVISDNEATCRVSARLIQSPGHSGAETYSVQSDVQYSGRLDVHTGKAHFNRIDAEAAKDIAAEALARLLIKIKPTEVSETQVKYVGTVARTQCIVVLSTEKSAEPVKWAVKKIECK